MPTISPFKILENKHYIKKFWEYLREHAVEIINFKKTKVKLPTKEQQ